MLFERQHLNASDSFAVDHLALPSTLCALCKDENPPISLSSVLFLIGLHSGVSLSLMAAFFSSVSCECASRTRRKRKSFSPLVKPGWSRIGCSLVLSLCSRSWLFGLGEDVAECFNLTSAVLERDAAALCPFRSRPDGKAFSSMSHAGSRRIVATQHRRQSFSVLWWTICHPFTSSAAGTFSGSFGWLMALVGLRAVTLCGGASGVW